MVPLPLDILIIPNIAQRMPPLAESIMFVTDFIVIWIVTVMLLLYSLFLFMMEGPFILILFVMILFAIYF